MVKTCRGSAYDHHSKRVAVSTETTTSDVLPSSTELYLYLQSQKKKTITWKYFAITNVVTCHYLRSFAYPTSQLTPDIKERDVVDSSAITVVSVILKDKMQGKIFKGLENKSIYIFISKMVSKFLA